jgi:hypothetical protein
LGGGPVSLVVLNSPLIEGTYPLIDGASGGSVSGSAASAATVEGLGFSPALANSLQIASGNLYLDSFAFLALSDFGHGLFGGENLGFTNIPEQLFYVWSSTNASLSVSNWTLVGAMQEHSLYPLPNASRYTINVSPTVSPTYYLAGTANTGPYLVSPVPAGTLTTADFTTFSLAEVNTGISTSGVLALGTVPILRDERPELHHSGQHQPDQLDEYRLRHGHHFAGDVHRFRHHKLSRTLLPRGVAVTDS